MKTKVIALCLCIIVLGQSCVSYQKASTPIDLAVGQGKAKIVTTSGSTFNINNISKIDSAYFGHLPNNTTNIPLEPADISAIYLKDEQASKVETVALTFGILFGSAILLTIIALNKAANEFGDFLKSL